MVKLKFFDGLLAIYIMATTLIFCSTVHAEPYGYTLDNFEYNPSDDSPLDHGWGVISGTGAASTEADSGLTAGDNIPGHYMLQIPILQIHNTMIFRDLLLSSFPNRPVPLRVSAC